jgi:uncharacterized protein YjbJ (UPF0337 family)
MHRIEELEVKGEEQMTNDIIEGQWKQIKGQVKEAWGELTDDELNQIEGRRDRLVGKLQERYGYTKREAQDELENFIDGLEENWDDAEDEPS